MRKAKYRDNAFGNASRMHSEGNLWEVCFSTRNASDRNLRFASDAFFSVCRTLTCGFITAFATAYLSLSLPSISTYLIGNRFFRRENMLTEHKDDNILSLYRVILFFVFFFFISNKILDPRNAVVYRKCKVTMQIMQVNYASLIR